ncbi:MAG: IS4 family transposase [Planctomycetes bacterium]|nr:IS4 family transposase [Planctomycetota bacterium]
MEKENPLDPKSVQGVKYLKRVFGLLERLAPAGTERDSAGNRTLLFSHYTGLILLGLFNPTLQSLRGLQQLSGLRKVQKLLGSRSASLGSESVRVFDPALMEPILQELIAELPKNLRHKPPADLPEELVRRLVAVDGSVLKTLPQIVAASGGKSTDWRLHLQFEVFRGVPGTAVITENNVGGEADERRVLARTLASGKTYLIDAGYERYGLFEQIVQEQSDYVCRVQRRKLEVLQERALSDEARAAGILSDEVVLPGRSRTNVGPITHSVRRIVIQAKSAPGRRRTDRKRSDEIILLTSLLGVPAEVIAAVYRLRWLIELFFRFFKHVLGCRELISLKTEGVAIGVYCALIAALLLSLAAGASVGRRGFELVCLFLQGWAEEDEVIAGLEKLARAKNRSSR